MNHPAEPPLSPLAMLRRIQGLFRELGLGGQTLTLSHAGHKYLAGCTNRTFTVYRLVAQGHLPPGHPGWPVCLVTEEMVVDEGSAPPLAEDEFASGLGLEDWLQLIEEQYRQK